MTDYLKKTYKFINQVYLGISLKQLCICSLLYLPVAKADSPPTPQPNAFEQIFPFLLIGLFFYFILIRPQQKKHKQHGDFLSKIKRGDEVLTSSGIYGRVEGLTDSFIILEVAENVRIRIVKSQIASYTGELKQQEEKNLTKK